MPILTLSTNIELDDTKPDLILDLSDLLKIKTDVDHYHFVFKQVSSSESPFKGDDPFCYR